MKYSKKIAKFAVGTALVELMISLVVILPDITTLCCRFCIDSDAGYMWVINLTIGLIVAVLMYGTLKEKKKRMLFSIITFFVSVLVLEFALWHRVEFQSLFATNITKDKIIGMIIGFISANVVLAMVLKGETTE